jgi:aminopeptidase N
MQAWAQRKQFNRKNPNRMRSLYGAFVMSNPKVFHSADGKGYQFLADLLLEIDQFNPQLASRMITPLLAFNQYDKVRKEGMLQRLRYLGQQKLSKDLFEKVNSALS